MTTSYRLILTGGENRDYELVDVASGERVRLSQLFSAPDRALVLDLTPQGVGERYPSLRY